MLALWGQAVRSGGAYCFAKWNLEHFLWRRGRPQRCGRWSTCLCELWSFKESIGDNFGMNALRLVYIDSIHSLDWQNGDRSSPTSGNPVMTHGTPDSPCSMTSRVMSSVGEAKRISGAAQKVSLVDMIDSISWSVAMGVE